MRDSAWEGHGGQDKQILAEAGRKQTGRLRACQFAGSPLVTIAFDEIQVSDRKLLYPSAMTAQGSRNPDATSISGRRVAYSEA